MNTAAGSCACAVTIRRPTHDHARLVDRTTQSVTRSEFKTTSQNTVEPPNTTRQTANITTSVLVGGRWVTSASSTPNGSIQVANVVATPYATSAAANRSVAMPASRAIDQRRPVASGPPRGTPLLAAAPTS